MRWVISLTLLFVALIVGMGYLIYRDEKQWEAFAKAHNCKIVAVQSGDVVTIVTYSVGPNGQMIPTMGTASTSEKKTYKCDDGVTYTR